MWERWQKGESLQQIAKLFDRDHSSVRGSWLLWWDSSRPAQPLRLALTLAEREEISRGVVAGNRSDRSLRFSTERHPRSAGRSSATVAKEATGPVRPTSPPGIGDGAPRPVNWSEPSVGAPRGRQAPTAVVTGADCRLAQAHLSRRYEPSGVPRDHLSQPVHPGPRRPEEGTGGAFAAHPSDAPFAPSHPEDGHHGKSLTPSRSASVPPALKTGRYPVTGKATCCSAARTARLRPWSSVRHAM